MRKRTSHTVGRQQGLDLLAAQITRHLQTTLTDVLAVREEMHRLLGLVEGENRRPCRLDVSGIRATLQTSLRRPDRPMDRIGVAAAMNYLTDSPYWMEWWGRDTRGNLVFVTHSLNPQQDAFYDYVTRSWFSAPRASGTPVVIGPYVDFGGINSYSYTVTISAPIITAHGFAGIAGADILADRFEHFLLGANPNREPVILANADLRVIASTTSTHLPGDLLQVHDLDSKSRLQIAKDLFPHGRSWQLLSPAS